MRLRAVWLSLFFLVGCGGTSLGTNQQELVAARQQWQDSHLSSYRYTVQRSGFIVPHDPVVITVHNGVPETAPDGFEAYNTVEKLFGIIDSALASHADVVTVAYDTAHSGYPQQIFIDQSLQIADEEYGLTITNFTPL